MASEYVYRVALVHPGTVLGGSRSIEDWLNDMSTNHGWRFVAALPTWNPNSPVGSMFVFEKAKGQ